MPTKPELDAGAGESDFPCSLTFTSSKFIVTAFGYTEEHCEDVLQCVLLGRFAKHEGDREFQRHKPWPPTTHTSRLSESVRRAAVSGTGMKEMICGTCEGPVTATVVDPFLRYKFQLFIGKRLPVTAPKGSVHKCHGGMGVMFCSKDCQEAFRKNALEAKGLYLANKGG